MAIPALVQLLSNGSQRGKKDAATTLKENAAAAMAHAQAQARDHAQAHARAQAQAHAYEFSVFDFELAYKQVLILDGNVDYPRKNRKPKREQDNNLATQTF
ncbi:hypothetical protein ACJX0J_038506, partial [Zea mays]